MAAILQDLVTVMHMCPRATPLAMITKRKSIHRFPLLERAAGALLKRAPGALLLITWFGSSLVTVNIPHGINVISMHIIPVFN